MVRDFLVVVGAVLLSTLSLIGIVSTARLFGVDPRELTASHFVMNGKNVVVALMVLIVPSVIIVIANGLLKCPFPGCVGLLTFDGKKLSLGLLVGAAVLSSSYLVRGMLWGWPSVSAAVPDHVDSWTLACYVAWIVLTLILNSISEELVFRAFPLMLAKQYQFSQLLSILMTSLLFAGIHFITRAPSLSDFTYLVLYGAVFCLFFVMTDSLWFVIGVHTGSNALSMLFAGNWKVGGFLKIQWPSETPSQSYTLSAVLALLILGLCFYQRIDAIRPKAVKFLRS
ncbi:MAG: CPBP family intramembrane glutamic endopeptidase [Bdellovibrionia bacterium]